VTEPDTEWQSLDRRTVAVTVVLAIGVTLASAIPLAINMLGDGRAPGFVVTAVAAALILVGGLAAISGLLRWRHTRYRITGDRIELRFTLVVHRLRSIPRDRVRSVDLTANPLLRLFGLVKVQVGTGQQTTGSAHLVLNPVTRQRAVALRQELLAVAAAPDRAAESGKRTLAQLDWSWIRYAPISATTVILGATALGGVLQLADWFGLRETILGEIGALLQGLPLPAAAGMLVAIGVGVGIVGSLALFIELWWGYRLLREEGGALRVHRGLLTTRSLSLEERRLRGVEVIEPIGARLLGAARVDAVAVGVRAKSGKEKSDPRTLLPLAPRSLAHRVAAGVLREPVSPTWSATFRPHPVAARGRRLYRAVGSALVVAGLLALSGLVLTPVLLDLAWVAVVVGVPVAVAVGLDAYRNLGHDICGDYMVARSGAVSRRTVALRRAGVIGWTITSSPFQRRVGLLTLVATTAANKGAYQIYDIGQSDGLRFADAAVPGLLTPFLDRSATSA
jgi:putative membrane protein